MSSITGKYQHYKNDNIDVYFAAVGVPYMIRKLIALSSPIIEFKLEGNKMTIKTSSLLRSSENTFQIGEEFEEVMPRGVLKSVASIIDDREVIIDTVIQGNGDKCRRHYLFSNDEVIETLTHEKVKEPSRRYFRRIVT